MKDDKKIYKDRQKSSLEASEAKQTFQTKEWQHTTISLFVIIV